MTCANPPARPSLRDLPCPRRGHSSAWITLAGCPAAENTPVAQSPEISLEQASLVFTPPCLPFPANPRTGHGLHPPLFCPLSLAPGPASRPCEHHGLCRPLWPQLPEPLRTEPGAIWSRSSQLSAPQDGGQLRQEWAGGGGGGEKEASPSRAKPQAGAAQPRALLNGSPSRAVPLPGPLPSHVPRHCALSQHLTS